jgi:hypothetical protein
VGKPAAFSFSFPEQLRAGKRKLLSLPLRLTHNNLREVLVMFCPQCGVESSTELKFCRSCGANLKVIGKAVSLSEAIARSDSVPAKIKDMVKNLKVEKVTDEITRAMEKMNEEITRSSHRQQKRLRWRKEKTPEQRRERHLTIGTIKLFWGSGLSIFLYFLTHALVLKLPADIIARVPFEIDPVVRVFWLIGLIPMLSGIGHILAGLTIRSRSVERTDESETPPLTIDSNFTPREYPDLTTRVSPREQPASITDRTTNILGHKIQSS